jgi:hypothetical protein
MKFSENDISKENFMYLDDAIIKEMGITNFKDRLQIKKLQHSFNVVLPSPTVAIPVIIPTQPDLIDVIDISAKSIFRYAKVNINDA